MEYGNYFQFFLSLIFIIGLIFAFSLIAKKLGLGHGPAITGNKQKRLQIKEVRPLDAKRKVVIVQCDNKEHVVLVGGTNDLHIDTIPCDPSSNQADSPEDVIDFKKADESSRV
ncbi:flagellar biosynthetic protein FliO [Kiloniella sp. EL199]|uniref:FliO/MopB family protein n=1 Tax=Kiloniella sp. EL199 TaxID=2107581 RepID=UPI000EA3AFFC|nr:flagellar biosynthetic protein FliO [Kiloniella sp. EL199]